MHPIAQEVNLLFFILIIDSVHKVWHTFSMCQD